jgi:hypothetical protein
MTPSNLILKHFLNFLEHKNPQEGESKATVSNCDMSIIEIEATIAVQGTIRSELETSLKKAQYESTIEPTMDARELNHVPCHRCVEGSKPM